MSSLKLGTLLIAAGVTAGCHSAGADRPPTVRFGEETCDECRMIIGDERFAAALVEPTGDALKFDDVGCLVVHEAGRLRNDVTYWVRDSRDGRWLQARKAQFVHSAKVASPMGYGLAALPAGRAADKSATLTRGRSLRFDELPGLLAEPARELGSGATEVRADGAATELPAAHRGPGGAGAVPRPSPEN